jgi:hypothetical protein
MEVELVSSVVVKHTRTSAQAWQRVIPTSQQVFEKLRHPSAAPTFTRDALVALTGLGMA